MSRKSRQPTPEELEAEVDALITGTPAASEESEDTGAPTEDTATTDDTTTETQTEDHTTDDEAQAKAAAEAKAKEEAEAKAKAEAEEDPDQITLENSKERVKNAQARMHQATTEAAKLKKELEDAKQGSSKIQATLDALQAEIADLRATRTNVTTAPAPVVTDAALNKLIDEYPDLKPLVNELGSLRHVVADLSAKNAALAKDVGTTKKELTEDQQKENIRRHFAAIDKVHPDRAALLASDDFNGWLARHPSQRHAYEAGSADEVIDMLDSYKATLRKPKAKVGVTVTAEPNVHSARSASGTKSTVKFTQAQIDAMSPEEFAKNEEAIDLAMSRGEIS
jgi:DNA repair exonuclease SbcCD ATPase subunit